LAVVGGGVIGLATAFRAVRAGMRVAVIERAAIGGGASNVAAGMLSPALEIEDCPPPFLEFAVESLARYPAFLAEIADVAAADCGFRSEGSLWLALDRDDQGLLEHLHAVQRGGGIDTHLLSPADARQREPNISPRVIGALLAPGDRQIDPRKFVLALADGIRALGGTVVEQAGDVRIGPERGRFAVTWAGGHFESTNVLAAAGCHTNDLLPDGVAKLPLRPVKGQTVRLRGAAVIDHVVRTPRVYLVPRASGEIVVGATMEEQGFDDRAKVWAVQDLLTEARRAVPALDELAVAELPVGFRPALRDNLPAIGAYGPRGLYVATGHYRHGILLAPATADLMLKLLEGERDERTHFDPNRFRDRAERRAHDGRSRAAG
jgi:glycine oxidase